MTLAKTCHASNVMQDLEKATYRPIATTKNVLNRNASMLHYCIEKMHVIVKLKVAMINK